MTGPRLARKLGISPKQVQHDARAGRIPRPIATQTKGGHWRYDETTPAFKTWFVKRRREIVKRKREDAMNAAVAKIPLRPRRSKPRQKIEIKRKDAWVKEYNPCNFHSVVREFGWIRRLEVKGEGIIDRDEARSDTLELFQWLKELHEPAARSHP